MSEAMRADASELRIICPFIKTGALESLLKHQPRKVQVITRFNLADFADGVSDLASLRRVLEIGGRVRGIKNLHAKLYLFGSSRVIITSANLTEAALNRNQEFGIVSQLPDSIETCQTYFDNLWKRGRTDLTLDQLKAWELIVTRYCASAKPSSRGGGLGDYGADAGITEPPSDTLPAAFTDARQAFIKFLGEGSNRAPLSYDTLEEIKRAGCHWAVAYPASKRPSGVKDGAIIFIGRLTREPNDIRIFGRAIGLAGCPKTP